MKIHNDEICVNLEKGDSFSKTPEELTCILCLGGVLADPYISPEIKENIARKLESLEEEVLNIKCAHCGKPRKGGYSCTHCGHSEHAVFKFGKNKDVPIFVGKKPGQEIYQKAVERWGMDSQVRMCQEECAELIVALNKALRYWNEGNAVRKTYEYHVCEEMADVEIMLEQLKLIFNEKLVKKIKHEKLDRLQEMLK